MTYPLDFILVSLICIPVSFIAGRSIIRFRLLKLFHSFSGKQTMNQIGILGYKSKRELEELDLYFRFIYKIIDCSVS